MALLERICSIRNHGLARITVCASGTGIALFALIPGAESVAPSPVIGVKFAVTTFLIVCSLLANRFRYANWLAAWLFFALAAFNIGQFIRGETTCGCLPLETGPLAMAAIDCVIGIGFALIVHPQYLAHGTAAQWSLILLATIGIVVGGMAGWDGGLRAAPAVASRQTPEHPIGIGDPCPAGTPDEMKLMLYRSGCQKCLQALTHLRTERTLTGGGILLAADLDAGTVLDLTSGEGLYSNAMQQMVDALPHTVIPAMITIEDGHVVKIEDMSRGGRW